eukprot:4182784-Amphidinium_carterae.1
MHEQVGMEETDAEASIAALSSFARCPDQPAFRWACTSDDSYGLCCPPQPLHRANGQASLQCDAR